LQFATDLIKKAYWACYR